nr:MAG TPA: hypothetical protein [Caudoviricetes sp.]
MNIKVDMGNGRVFTCEQLASALTLVIENMILKPKVTQDRFLITLEYKYHKDGKTKRLRQALSKMVMETFNGTVEAYIYNVRQQMKEIIVKGELNYDE